MKGKGWRVGHVRIEFSFSLKTRVSGSRWVDGTPLVELVRDAGEKQKWRGICEFSEKERPVGWLSGEDDGN